ncbi:MAG: DUF445 family protein [Moraxellaceae bacterium]|nr:MAG: DUF445 family protein [Moraxellaceae bacterium]
MMDRKVAELQRMKTFCLLLLLGCVAMSVILEVSAPHSRNIVLIFLKGAFEAAVVGAMADWYAVVALFRHPLGISSLPHTAIIPRKKDDIGENLGKFVQNEFMDDAVVIAKIKEFDPIEKLFLWLEAREKDYFVSNFIRQAMISLLTDKSAMYIHEFTRQGIVKFINEANTANILAQLIQLVNDDKNRNDILNKFFGNTWLSLKESTQLLSL